MNDFSRDGSRSKEHRSENGNSVDDITAATIPIDITRSAVRLGRNIMSNQSVANLTPCCTASLE